MVKLSFRWYRVAVMLVVILMGVGTLRLDSVQKASASDCTVEAFSVSPSSSSQVVGTILSLYGRGNCAGGIRASRFNIDGGGFGEDAGATEQSETWQLTAGSHTICFEISGGSNGDWSAGASRCTTITGTTTNPPNPSTCTIEFFNATPSSPVVLGTEVTLHGRGNCGTSRFEINGQPRAEIGAPEQTETWRTAEFGVGTYNVCYVLRGDGGWENADRECKTYVVTSTAQPPTPTPPPTPGVCQVNRFTVSPGGGTPGTIFTFSGSGACNIGVRAVRFLIDGSPFGEIGAPSQTVTWNSSGSAEGNHIISFQVVAGNWDQAATSSVNLILSSSTSTTDPISGNVTTNIPNVSVEPISTVEIWRGYGFPPTGSYIRVNVAHLNVRYGPDTGYPKVAQLERNDYYPVLETNGEWVRIATQIGEGWVYIGEGFANLYINQANNQPSLEVISGYEVNVRSEPSINSGIKGTIYSGDLYTVVGKNGNSFWLEINYGGQTGWVCREYTTDSGDIFLVPVTNPTKEDCAGQTTSVSESTPTPSATEESQSDTPKLGRNCQIDADQIMCRAVGVVENIQAGDAYAGVFELPSNDGPTNPAERITLVWFRGIFWDFTGDHYCGPGALPEFRDVQTGEIIRPQPGFQLVPACVHLIDIAQAQGRDQASRWYLFYSKP